MTKTAEATTTKIYFVVWNESPQIDRKNSNFESQVYDTLFAITNSIKMTRISKVALAKMVLPGFNTKAQTKQYKKIRWHLK